MPQPLDPTPARHDEAERLITLARGLLNRPEEEMVAICLDQAVETLRIVAEGKSSDIASRTSSR